MVETKTNKSNTEKIYEVTIRMERIIEELGIHKTQKFKVLES